MALEAWELHQRQQGNIHAADMAQAMRSQWGDINLVTLAGTTSASALVEQLRAEYKTKLGKEIVLPEPRPELLEMGKILTAERFNVDPIVYLNKGKVTYALLDRSARPNYDGGKQLFEDDGFVPILERGRSSGQIERVSWTRDVPAKSRFGVSWNEANGYIAREVVNVSPHLSKLVEASGTQFRVPTKEEFQFAGGLRYSHFGEANTWEWLFDKSGFDDRLVGGFSGFGGLEAVDDDHPDFHGGGVAFRLQGVLPSQKV